jgi:hypothetical protein
VLEELIGLRERFIGHNCTRHQEGRARPRGGRRVAFCWTIWDQL